MSLFMWDCTTSLFLVPESHILRQCLTFWLVLHDMLFSKVWNLSSVWKGKSFLLKPIWCQKVTSFGVFVEHDGKYHKVNEATEFLLFYLVFFFSFNNNINNKTLSEKMSKINGRDKKTYTNKKVVQHLKQRVCVWFLFLAITSFSSSNNKPVDPQRQQTVIADVW